MSKFNAGAAEFTPGVGGSKLTATASEFIPGSKMQACAGEFVPGSKFTAASSEFVPGQGAWGWTEEAADSSEWSYGRRDAYQNTALMGYNNGYGVANPQGLQRACTPDSGCWFNADAYSTESSSPRGSVIAPDDVAEADDSKSATTYTPALAATPDTTSPAVFRHEAATSTSARESATEEKNNRAKSSASTSGPVAEMSETTMKEWLQRFADDSDGSLLVGQWRQWTNSPRNEEQQLRGKTVVDWLLRSGLDDCKGASLIEKVTAKLLRSDATIGQLLETGLAEYSGEDLEDIALDNPKASDFFAAMKEILAAPATEKSVAEEAKPDAMPSSDCAGADSACSYSARMLVAVRKYMMSHGAFDEAQLEASGLPRWRSEPATNFEKPEKERSSAKGSSEQRRSRLSGAPKSDGADWRSGGAGTGGGSGARKSDPVMTASPTSWAAQLKLAKEAKEKASEADINDEHLLREMRGTLNKLTVEKFEQLSDHLVKLVARSNRPNRGIPMLMQLVFEKATTQHHFINMYVSLCVKLHRWLTDEGNVSSVGESQGNFKRILLNQCQLSFEQYLEPPEGFEGLVGDELFECQVKYKTKMLGNIKLVGELIKHGMLVSKIAIGVAEELTRDDPVVREERLETLSVFLETIGPSLDDSTWTHYPALNRIFNELGMLTKDATIPTRIRCLMRDTLDLRRSNWQAKKARDHGKEGPSSIAEVHEKAKIDNSGQKPRGRGFSSGGEMSVGAMSGKEKFGLSRPKVLGRRGNDSDSSATESAPRPWVGRSHAASSKPPASPSLSPHVSPQKPPPSPGAPGKVSTPSTPNLVSKNGASDGVPKMPLSPASLPAATSVAPANGNAAATAAPAASSTQPAPSRKEVLQAFHKELAGAIRQVGGGSLGITDAVDRLRASGPLPAGSELEEAADLIARIVDEPKDARQRLIPLLPALVNASVLAAPGVLGKAVENFAADAFADPDDVDPPNLADILMSEVLPALGLVPSALDLPAAVVA